MHWSNKFAYSIGLITTDGNLSTDKRHITFVSKDYEQIRNFQIGLNLKNKISQKRGGYNPNKYYYFTQFGNIKLYNFLVKIGLMPNKSKKLKQLGIPDKYFSHFLRGCFDGDGFTYSYWDKRWKSSFMLYFGLVSASLIFLLWLKKKIFHLYNIKSHINRNKPSFYLLIFSKKESIKLIKKIYSGKNIIFLKRKKYKIDQSLGIIYKQAGMLELVDRHA